MDFGLCGAARDRYPQMATAIKRIEQIVDLALRIG